MITTDKLIKICPACKEPAEWARLLDNHLLEDGFNAQQAAMFVAQTSHESADYNTLAENLNYSSDRLLVVFPKYFKGKNDLSKYHRVPEAIANVVYSNRMGNGDEASGEGYKFRGRGILQVTGKSNYMKCSEFIYGNEETLIDDPDLLLHKEDAINSAIWYWTVNDLKSIKSVEKSTKLINGGFNGLPDRINRYDTAVRLFT